MRWRYKKMTNLTEKEDRELASIEVTSPNRLNFKAINPNWLLKEK